jgi:hypothetical protein
MADVLGGFEQAVLLAIVRLGEEAYGRAILKEAQGRLDRDVAAGAVHSTLERLFALDGLAVTTSSRLAVPALSMTRERRWTPSGAGFGGR